MGRPPNAPNHQSPTRPWAPPLNLTGGSLLRGTFTPHSNKVRQFVLPIPPVPTTTAKAIRESLASTVQPFAAQQNRIRVLTSKVLDQRAKAAASQKRIVELEDEKEQGLRDIRETRQQETADIVAVVERKLRSRYNKEAAAVHAQWKENLEEECETKRKAWRQQQQQEEEELKEEGQICSSQEDEPEKKRTKLEVDEQENEKSDDTLGSNARVTSSDTANTTTTSETETTSVEPQNKEKKKSDLLREQLTESKAALDKLTETRSEMIWLLKQVIKAEEKLNKTTTSTGSAAAMATTSQKR